MRAAAPLPGFRTNFTVKGSSTSPSSPCVTKMDDAVVIVLPRAEKATERLPTDDGGQH